MIGFSLLTLFYVNNPIIYREYLIKEVDSNNNTIYNDTQISNAAEMSAVDKLVITKFILMYFLCGVTFALISFFAYAIRQKSTNWIFDLNNYNIVNI